MLTDLLNLLGMFSLPVLSIHSVGEKYGSFTTEKASGLLTLVSKSLTPKGTGTGKVFGGTRRGESFLSEQKETPNPLRTLEGDRVRQMHKERWVGGHGPWRMLSMAPVTPLYILSSQVSLFSFSHNYIQLHASPTTKIHFFRYLIEAGAINSWYH